jgi:ABC-type molybdate transport system ATPase subunit
MSSPLNITLSQDEILVLFEALANLDDKAQLDVLSDEERSAVWKIEALCEKNAEAIFDPKYKEVFERARAMARKKGLLFALTEEERSFVHNALNEVCHGIQIEDPEFQMRLGCDRATLIALLARI